MRDIIDKMLDKAQYRVFRFGVFLAAGLAVFTGYKGAAVQAIFLFTLWSVRQVLNFVKNKANAYILSWPAVVNSFENACSGNISFTFASNIYQCLEKSF